MEEPGEAAYALIRVATATKAVQCIYVDTISEAKLMFLIAVPTDKGNRGKHVPGRKTPTLSNCHCNDTDISRTVERIDAKFCKLVRHNLPYIISLLAIHQGLTLVWLVLRLANALATCHALVWMARPIIVCSLFRWNTAVIWLFGTHHLRNC